MSVCAAATSAAFRATSVAGAWSATYQDRFQKRSLAAFRMRKRYDFGSTRRGRVGRAVDDRRVVELLHADVMFGVPGICCGSQNGSTWYCHVVVIEVAGSRLQGRAPPVGWLNGGLAFGSML